MPTSHTRATHADAWDRLTAETMFQASRYLTPERAATLACGQAYVAYQEAMQNRFCGRDRGDAALARLAWLKAESWLVTLRASRPKPNEFDAARWGRKGTR